MTKKVFFAHNACLNAAYDLNVLRAGIEASGQQIVDRPELADEIVFSGCSVREHWVDDAINQLHQAHLRSPEARIVVTGCIANTSSQTIRSRLSGAQISFLSTQEVLRESSDLLFAEVDRVFSQGAGSSFEPPLSDGLHSLRRRVGAAKSHVLAMLEEEDRRYGTHLVRIYRQTTKGFVFYDEQDPCELITVTRSCPYHCSFCNIPLGRGDFQSVPLKDIVAKAHTAISNGRYHIVLIGDEVGNYGIGTDGVRFPEMVLAVLSLHPSITISIRYIEPKPFLKYFEKLLPWSQTGRLKLVYISLQSGSPRVLKAMRRGYDIEKIANALREFRHSGSTVLYGNWLVGFPGEQEEDFQATVVSTGRSVSNEERGYLYSLAKHHSSRYALLLKTKLDESIPLGPGRDLDRTFRSEVDQQIGQVLNQLDLLSLDPNGERARNRITEELDAITIK